MSQAGASSINTIPPALVVETLTGNSGGAVGPTGNNINTVGTGSITVVGSPGTSTLTTQLTGLTNHAVLVGAGTATITKVGPSASTGQILQNNAAADPSYSTATYPSTTTVSQILYSSATNVVSGLATANDGVLITGNTGVPSWLANGTTGQVLTATTGSPPSWAAAGGGSVVKFSAWLSAAAAGVTGDGTNYTILFDTVVVDSASGYNAGTGTYTFPSTGVYVIAYNVFYSGIIVTNTTGQALLSTGALSTNAGLTDFNAFNLSVSGNICIGASQLVSVTAADTANIIAAVYGNGAKNVTIGSGATQRWTNFTVYQLA